MARNLGVGQLRDAILEDLRTHQPLLDALDTSDLGTVDGPDDPVEQIHSRQTIEDTDYPVVVSVGLTRAGGGAVTSSSTSANFHVTIVVTARLEWRQAINQSSAYGLSESFMDDILSIAGARATLGFGVPNLRPGGLVGGAGADELVADDGGEWSVAGRWQVTRTVVGDDGPRRSDW